MSVVARDALTSIPGVWRGLGRPRADAEPTGIIELDDALAGGWPRGALSQLVSHEIGLGLSLITPVLARMTQAKRPVALIAPPFIPYAPALRDAGIDLQHLLWIEPKDRVDALWATEQMLRAGLFAVVALWSPSLEAAVERRLQLAAETGRNVGIVSQHGRCDAQSVVAVRLQLSSSPSGLHVDVARCRGARAGAHIDVRWPDALAA
jgi:hypothetical protein